MSGDVMLLFMVVSSLVLSFILFSVSLVNSIIGAFSSLFFQRLKFIAAFFMARL